MKTYISIGIVTNTLFLLQNVKKFDCYSINEISNITNKYVSFEMTENFAVQCGWLEVVDRKFRLTDSGERLLEMFDGIIIDISLWRSVLKDYILCSKPAWAHRIPAGRKEAFIFMQDEEKRCFLEAKLMISPPSSDVVMWWDEIAKNERENVNEQLNVTGRVGERLTIEYEQQRTGKQPIWQSIETNLVGYDLISQRDEKSTDEILIEVKTSVCDLEHAKMSVSRHEWEVANYQYNYKRYFFYLWCLSEGKKLAIISVADINEHIPSESGNGHWSSISIPFNTFQKKFIFIE